jgi:hypothetical protein
MLRKPERPPARNLYERIRARFESLPSFSTPASCRQSWPSEVAAWIACQLEDALFATAISQAEIQSGLADIPEGRRRFALEIAGQAYSQAILTGVC